MKKEKKRKRKSEAAFLMQWHSSQGRVMAIQTPLKNSRGVNRVC